MPAHDKWLRRLRILSAAGELGRARLLIAFVPFGRWSKSLGSVEVADTSPPRADSRSTEALEVAALVDRAAALLPFHSKCLPRAIALSRMLRRRGIRHTLVIAVRPEHLRNAADGLHAWIEVDGAKILGDLPGPWFETLRLGA